MDYKNYCLNKRSQVILNGPDPVPNKYVQHLAYLFPNPVASFVIYYSKEGNLKSELQSLFSSKKLTTSELQADHLADITYYYAIFVLSISLLVTIVRFLKG